MPKGSGGKMITLFFIEKQLGYSVGLTSKYPIEVCRKNNGRYGITVRCTAKPMELMFW